MRNEKKRRIPFRWVGWTLTLCHLFKCPHPARPALNKLITPDPNPTVAGQSFFIHITRVQFHLSNQPSCRKNLTPFHPLPVTTPSRGCTPSPGSLATTLTSRSTSSWEIEMVWNITAWEIKSIHLKWDSTCSSGEKNISYMCPYFLSWPLRRRTDWVQTPTLHHNMRSS